MSQLRFRFLLLISWLWIAAGPLPAEVVVDDTWADGTGSDSNLPADAYDAESLAASDGRFEMDVLSAGPIAPANPTQPQSKTTTVGQYVEFAVAASGPAPLSYQWFKEHSAISGATGASLLLTNGQLCDGASYYVAASNGNGSTRSAVATLTITPPKLPTPSFVAPHPQRKIAIGGQTVVTAADSSSLSQQWSKGNSPSIGQVSATLDQQSVRFADAASFPTVETDSLNSAQSDEETLTANQAVIGGVPKFDLVGFAALDGFASSGTSLQGGTTGGTGGTHVQVTTLADLKTYLESTTTYEVEVMNDIDLSSLANHSGSFPADYPTGEILVRSNKTIYSKNGATIHRGSLRIGKASLGPQKNIIIRNLRFRDLWVLDPSGNYDTYGWDYVHIEEGCHHIWVDHCDFEKSYDGMIDMTHAVDFVTVSWCVFRNQKKCHLIGHSDSNSAEDTGHLNVTFHHNYYLSVDERLPRMRFGNAHVFNLYCESLGGNGVQSTANATTLVENCYFYHPKSGSLPTREENGGLLGVIKVNGSVIENLPGVNVTFRERVTGGGFTFNPPFASATPPYPYTPDPVADVPYLVTQYAGLGKLGFIFWQQEQFNYEELADPSVSGPTAAPFGDGITNLTRYALGVPPDASAANYLPSLHLDGAGKGKFTYSRPATATDVIYRIQVSTNLSAWSEGNVTQQLVGTDAAGVQTWEASYTGPAAPAVFFRLRIDR